MQLVSRWMTGPVLQPGKIVPALEALIMPADRVVIEGDNQKQADFLSRSLAKVDPGNLHDLHMIQSSVIRQARDSATILGAIRERRSRRGRTHSIIAVTIPMGTCLV
jgi:hypothetical protein